MYMIKGCYTVSHFWYHKWYVFSICFLEFKKIEFQNTYDFKASRWEIMDI